MLVLLPGLMCDAAVWTDQCAALTQAECVVQVWGRLDSIEAMARAVLASDIDDRFALAGHSMGGRIALEIVRLAPERVTRLALLDTGLDSIAPGAAGETERRQRMALLATAREYGMVAMARAWAAGMVHPQHNPGPLFDAVVAMVARNTPDDFEAQIHALLGRPDAHATFAGLRCPTLLACGRQDTWSPLVRHEQMQAELPSAHLVVIEDSGHMTTMEQPQAVTQALADWLQLDT